MRICIKGDGHNMNLAFPTCLIFNRGTAWLAGTVGKHYAGDAMPDIPPEAMYAIIRELQWIKKKHGSWELVDVETSDGQGVKITL